MMGSCGCAVKMSGAVRYQAILEDSRSSIDGAVIGGGGLPRGDHVSEFMRNFRARPAEEEEAEQEEEEVAAE